MITTIRLSEPTHKVEVEFGLFDFQETIAAKRAQWTHENCVLCPPPTSERYYTDVPKKCKHSLVATCFGAERHFRHTGKIRAVDAVV